MKVSTLAKKEKALVIRVGDDAEDLVHVVYKPGALTLEVADSIKEIMLSGFEFDIAFAILEPMLVSWDLENDDGSPFPVTAEAIKKVPIEFLGLILSGIEKDARPNPTMGETSQGTSPQTESSEGSLTGTSSPEQPSTGDVGPGSSLIDQ